MNVNRLRTRLIISYLAVVLVTVFIMAILLVLLLRAQPVAREPIVERLITLSSSVNQREGVMSLLLSLANDDRREQTLDQIASQARVRVLVGLENGEVLYDSLRYYAAGDSLTIANAEPIPQHKLPPAPVGILRPNNTNTTDQPVLNLQQGNFYQNGEEWVFILQPIRTRQQGTIYFLLAVVRPQSSWAEVLNIFGTSLLIPLFQATLIGLVIAVVMAWLVSRGLVGGLNGLRQVAGAVAKGDYHERVTPRGPDEVRDVAAAFNHMTEQVQAAQIAQQDFLANVSHDLRTPLTSIQGFSQAIIDGTSQDPAHHARIIHDEAARLNRMVGELLDLARVSAGRLNMRHRQIDLTALVEQVAESLSIKARNKGVHLVRDIQPGPSIAGDGDRLAQVMTNLIDNAIKFTPQGGTVRVSARTAQGGIEISVSDTGQGIPPEDLPRIFERFYQVDKARGPRRGTGLGLAITAEIVQAHGGCIHATSGGSGQGTTFTVWFPALGMSTVVRRM
jgi:signal transduction histidine kinase